MRFLSSRRLAILLAALGLVAASCADFVDGLPHLKKRDLRFRPPQSSKLYASDGSLIKTFHGEQNRTVVPLKRVPKHLQEAIVAIEDQRFYEHDGVDLKAIIRAAVTNAASGEVEEGGSTITQQYVKQTIIAPGKIAKKSYERKIQEAALARQIEERLSKDEILERYMNTVYFGQGAYGVQAASRAYFGRPVNKIGLGEAALLAGVIQQPGTFDPFERPKAAKRRRNTVIDKMVQLGYVDPVKGAKVGAKKLGLQPPEDKDTYPAPYFIDYVQRLLTYDPRFKALGNTVQQRTKSLFQGGLRIHTTVDLRMQAAAEDAINGTLPYETDPFGSLVAVEPETGYVKAMVGGRDYFAKDKKTRSGKFAKFNMAITGEPGLGPKKEGGTAPGNGRQAGSAFKAFTLSAAVEEGIPLSKQYIAKDCLDLTQYAAGYTPCNYEGQAFGPVSLLEATVSSINVVYLQLGLDIGIEATSEAAMAMGIRTGQGEDNALLPIISAPLGTQPVNPLGMASGYSTLANHGSYHPPVAVTEIYDTTQGKVIFEDKSKARQAILPTTAFIVTSALQGVISGGTGTAASIGRPAAGKTGTGQQYRDAWFAGYTPQLAAAVWVGHPEGEIDMTSERIGLVTGGSWPAQIWQAFMLNAMLGLAVESFGAPTGLTYHSIDVRTGCRATDSTPDEYVQSAPFASGAVPADPSSSECAVPEVNVTVPDVFSFPVDEAVAVLEGDGFVVDINEVEDSSYPPGRVIDQSPAGETEAPQGSTVTLTVSARGGDD
ncbi:MAG: penicillin-binding protein [Actinomycetota bacterium]